MAGARLDPLPAWRRTGLPRTWRGRAVRRCASGTRGGREKEGWGPLELRGGHLLDLFGPRRRSLRPAPPLSPRRQRRSAAAAPLAFPSPIARARRARCLAAPLWNGERRTSPLVPSVRRTCRCKSTTSRTRPSTASCTSCRSTCARSSRSPAARASSCAAAALSTSRMHAGAPLRGRLAQSAAWSAHSMQACSATQLRAPRTP